MLSALEPADPGEPRLIVDRQTFSDPARIVEIRKEQRVTPEYALSEPPDSACPVEMEDVSELVRYDELVPVGVVPQTLRVGGWMRVDDDPVRRKGRRVAVYVVGVVGENEVDGSTRWNQLPGKAGVRALRVGRGALRLFSELGSEGDSEMRGADRPPAGVGDELRVRPLRPSDRERGDEKRARY